MKVNFWFFINDETHEIRCWVSDCLKVVQIYLWNPVEQSEWLGEAQQNCNNFEDGCAILWFNGHSNSKIIQK